jgi:carboxyl-terminal processing protease
MKKILLIFLLLLFTLNCKSQVSIDFCEQLEKLQELINTKHYSPKQLNDVSSQSILKLFIDNLDLNKHFFTQQDIKLFNADATKIDDYLKLNQCDFIDTYITKLTQKINTSKQIIKSFDHSVFDYSGKDNLVINSKDKLEYPKDAKDLKRYWSQRVRYLIIKKIIEDNVDNKILGRDFRTLEKAVKPSIISNQICLIDELLNQNGGIEQFVKNEFLNAYVKFQDPNSSYFSFSDKMVFEHSIAKNQLTFGILTAKDKSGDIVIKKILPGSAAFKSTKIDEDDIIISITSGNDKLETLCISNSDILDFFNNNNHKKIKLSIRKRSGTVEDVELTKTRVKVEGNAIRAYILGNELKIGYIKIPSFYTDLESPFGLGLANDVAKEIFRLQKENVKGLIIDLRFNGGGSMREAADLSGMFINKGPLSIIKQKNGHSFTIKDYKRGSLFTKPILILINNYSASASEFFAAAMQDYNRAIIVGSTSYGKSSAQVILPLDNTKNLGFCKVTQEKFYRITGQSHQSKGVIPDVVLPSFYDGFKISERFETHAFINDSIAVKLKHTPSKAIDFNSINKKSKFRIDTSLVFKKIKTVNHKLLSDYINKQVNYPLTLRNVKNDLDHFNKIWDDYKNIDDLKTGIIPVKNTKFLEELLQYDAEESELNVTTLDDISKNSYIIESYNIISDLMGLKKKSGQ